MLVRTLTSGRFQANCYVVAPEAGEECVVIDPGEGAAPLVERTVRELGLKPVAVLLTHGHLDHVANVLPIAGTHEATCWIHAADRTLLSNPYAGLPAAWAQALLGPDASLAEPEDVRELSDGVHVEIAGLSFLVDHAPGHTRGSVMFSSSRTAETGDGRSEAPESGTLFAGDVIFAGSIGRTDLPGGDPTAMRTSLEEKVLPLPDTTRMFPGHGGSTTMGHERRTNPFLRELAAPTDA